MYLVACVKDKAAGSRPARRLYRSVWFKKARTYVESRGDWRILSAKHGLVAPTQVIEPYEETLNTMPVAERKRWAERVLQGLELILVLGEPVIFLAGARYREFLVKPLLHRGHEIHIPMEGLSIGRQLSWLNQHL